MITYEKDLERANSSLQEKLERALLDLEKSEQIRKVLCERVDKCGDRWLYFSSLLQSCCKDTSISQIINLPSYIKGVFSRTDDHLNRGLYEEPNSFCVAKKYYSKSIRKSFGLFTQSEIIGKEYGGVNSERIRDKGFLPMLCVDGQFSYYNLWLHRNDKSFFHQRNLWDFLAHWHGSDDTESIY